MTLLFQTQNPKKEKRKKKKSHISLSRCVCVYMFPFLIYDSLSLSLSLSLSGQNNERGCDDGFVDVKSVEVSSIAKKGPFFNLKPNRSSFYFLIFLVWLLRK